MSSSLRPAWPHAGMPLFPYLIEWKNSSSLFELMYAASWKSRGLGLSAAPAGPSPCPCGPWQVEHLASKMTLPFAGSPPLPFSVAAEAVVLFAGAAIDVLSAGVVPPDGALEVSSLFLPHPRIAGRRITALARPATASTPVTVRRIPHPPFDPVATRRPPPGGGLRRPRRRSATGRTCVACVPCSVVGDGGGRDCAQQRGRATIAIGSVESAGNLCPAPRSCQSAC